MTGTAPGERSPLAPLRAGCSILNVKLYVVNSTFDNLLQEVLAPVSKRLLGFRGSQVRTAAGARRIPSCFPHLTTSLYAGRLSAGTMQAHLRDSAGSVPTIK